LEARLRPPAQSHPLEEYQNPTIGFTCPLDFAAISGGNGRMITRRDLTVASLAILLAATVMALAQSAGKPVLHSSVFQWADLTPTSTKTGERRAVFDAPTPMLARLECHVTTLNPGEAPHPGHRHPEEEMMVVKEGTLAAMQGEQTNLVPAGGIIFEAANELHGLRNPGTNQVTYYVIKFAVHDPAK
jgi:quercetin dioxygenase-like cupin family protein